jgi:hypothetical protein
MSSPELPDRKQPEQLRRGYVTLAGELIRPDLALRLKTVIDPSTGRAQEAALFGYQALQAGTVLRASITADADVDVALLSQLQQVLAGELLLGRSRSAEYGRAEAQIRDQIPIQQGPNSGVELTLWLLADLSALDSGGQPTLCPKPEWLGLPTGELLVERSFLRTRRYSPWNAHKHGRDLERQVIAQGSVLVFSLEQPLEASHLVAVDAGLGAHREAGFGRVWINPPLLANTHPKFESLEHPTPENAKASEPTPVSDSPLISWLRARVERQTAGESNAARARELVANLRERLADARRLRGLLAGTPVGPSASQWGAVLQAAKSRGDDLNSTLFDPSNGLCKPDAPGWQDQFWDARDQCLRNFAGWIKTIWETQPDRRLIQHLAREAMAMVKQENRRTERSNSPAEETSRDA